MRIPARLATFSPHPMSSPPSDPELPQERGKKTYIGLPPGVYNIQSDTKKNVVNANNNGGQLYVSDPNSQAKQQVKSFFC